MKYWDDFVTREDFETEPGVVDEDKVRAVRLNTYLRYVGDFIEMKGHDYPDVAFEQVEDFMTNDFMCCTHMMEGRYPEPEEIAEYLRKPENFEARQYWTYICVHANRDNWPDFVKQIREKWNVPEEVEAGNEEEREKMNQKVIRERTWTHKEL